MIGNGSVPEETCESSPVRSAGIERAARPVPAGTIEHLLPADWSSLRAFLVCRMDAYARSRLAARPAFLVADLGIQGTG